MSDLYSVVHKCCIKWQYGIIAKCACVSTSKETLKCDWLHTIILYNDYIILALQISQLKCLNEKLECLKIM